jgi:hypothetical protein
MKKFGIGVLFGIAIATMAFVPLLISERREKFEYGLKNGMIAGRREAAQAIEKEFGLYDGHSPYNRLFSVKTTDVISIETNGTKTIRVIP